MPGAMASVSYSTNELKDWKPGMHLGLRVRSKGTSRNHTMPGESATEPCLLKGQAAQHAGQGKNCPTIGGSVFVSTDRSIFVSAEGHARIEAKGPGGWTFGKGRYPPGAVDRTMRRLPRLRPSSVVATYAEPRFPQHVDCNLLDPQLNLEVTALITHISPDTLPDLRHRNRRVCSGHGKPHAPSATNGLTALLVFRGDPSSGRP